MSAAPSRPGTSRVALALALIGCQGTSPSERSPTAASAPTTAPPPASEPLAPTHATTPAAPAAPASPAAPAPDSPAAPASLASPDSPAAAAPDSPPFDGPLSATALDGGALLVWSVHDADANQSHLLAALLDARGAPVGEPRVLRRTTGEVLDLAVHRRGDHVWLAWLSLLATDPRPRALVAAAQVDPDLASIAAPITLGQFSDDSLDAWPGRPMVRLLALPEGQAVVVAAGAPVECVDSVEERPARCPGFDLFHLRADGTSTLAGRFGPDGGDPGLGALVDIGDGVVVDAWAWHGGPTFASAYLPHGGALAPSPLPLATCRPPFERAFTGAELVTLCPADYAADGERCVLDGEAAEEGMCARVAIARAGKRSGASAPPLTSRRRRCHAGHPVLEVTWKGGRLLVDPLAPGASADLDLGVWTGQRALYVADGAGERWRCDGDELVIDAPLDLGPLLRADPAPLRRVPARKAPAG